MRTRCFRRRRYLGACGPALLSRKTLGTACYVVEMTTNRRDRDQNRRNRIRPGVGHICPERVLRA